MNMRTLIINYKAYEEAFTKGEEIADFIRNIKNDKINILLAPPFTLIKEFSNKAKTIAQGMDECAPGAFTAHVTWYELKKSGAVGTLLNHSEKRYSYSKDGIIAYPELNKAINSCKQNGLESYVCVQNLEEAEKIVKMGPTAVCYEPPELIGGDISVSNSKPDIVKEFCDLIKKNSDSLALIYDGRVTPCIVIPYITT